ncbi:alpha/beta hydrolase [Streptomyces sp. NBC_00190]|uniref:alpha/beta hydrolase n=1 Tax=unclassified Streptomyces TaxID=2593676 RepID=UPI002E2AFED7|nr:alpha/beta hydrolase fold domain-containing protein [Streptomyces sp. NBC_00190]WSZ44468.1 alpha/beta hydrolase [Streptomyces sp. NBC_00868]
MPLGYLWTVVFVAAGTLFALAPVRRPRPLTDLSFRIGLVIGELPFVALAWLLLWTAVAFAQGDVDGPGSWAAVALAVITAAGLVLVVRRGLRARTEVERALAEGLGIDWRAAIAPDATVGLRGHRTLARILFRPFAGRPRAVVRVADLRYGPGGRRHQLDVYHHRARPSGAPVLIHLHGGSYRGGRKSTQSLPLLHRLASRGWVCVSANYRLRPEVRHPEHLIDAKRVIAWVREHGRAYGADPATLFMAGSSAGGHMAALAALTPGDPALQPGFETADTSVTAVIGLNGYYGPYYGQGPESSPSAHITADAPPFFLVHGDRDTMVHVDIARRFAADLREASVGTVVYAELPGAQHAFDLFHSLRFEAVVDGVEAFAGWVISREWAP